MKMGTDLLSSRQKLFSVSVLSLLLLLLITGCPDESDPDNWGTVSGGAMQGINGFEGQIAAIISVDPGAGPYGTPVDVTVEFTSGAELVEAVYLYDAMGTINPRQFLYFQLRDTLDQMSASVWVGSDFLFLTGFAGVARFYAVNDEGDKICVGDVLVNGGMDVPNWQNDGIGTTKDLEVLDMDPGTVSGGVGTLFMFDRR